MISEITKVFNWLQASGILAATVSFALVLYKSAYPWLESHMRSKQQKQLAAYALASVTKIATWSSLSLTDRKKSAVSELMSFAEKFKITWVNQTVAETIVELAYQEFKKLNYDNHKVVADDSEATQAETSTDESVSDDAAAELKDLSDDQKDTATVSEAK